MVFANPEEELIVAESELCIDYEVTIPLDMYKLTRELLLQNTEIVTFRISHNQYISGWTLRGWWCCSWNRRGGDETLEEVIINQPVDQDSCSKPIANNFQNCGVPLWQVGRYYWGGEEEFPWRSDCLVYLISQYFSLVVGHHLVLARNLIVSAAILLWSEGAFETRKIVAVILRAWKEFPYPWAASIRNTGTSLWSNCRMCEERKEI